MQLGQILTLETHGPDTFVGSGPRYPWGGLYGGQIVAQALRAAAHTVADHYEVHSLHAYFIRRGDQDAPVRYEVDRLRDGRSYCTRAVVARQAVGAILNLSASFHTHETDAEVQPATFPQVAPPAELPEDSWSPAFRRHVVEVDGPGREVAWARVGEDLGDDPLVGAAALAYVSDDFPTGAAVRLHPMTAEHGGWQEGMFMSASLDHAIWFHRRVRADEWLLYDTRATSMRGARALTHGGVFNEAGEHVATFAQETVLRRNASFAP